ncbi:hypothetical protein M4D70_21605 [Brevibacillus borstelensis]|uniref:hypothetical protein n=1 Tax=Brevibacillus borstelensis TaxID=45462 RepID=UPI00203E3472|nr:hypothetical protein [Brevibacillus borstelensis]MCM3624825.1 hypothetical protein [Brevibacillus borstelensis]
MSSDDKKLLRSKGQKSSITWRWDEEGKRSSYFKITAANEEKIIQGQEIIDSMTDEERKVLRSKSGTLHFKRLLTLGSVRYKGQSKPVGVALVSDEDISVPVIDVMKNQETGIDVEKDISSRNVKAGEEFYLTYYEFMFLIIRDEYGGYFEANDNPYGAHLSVKSTFKKKVAKLPTPTINFAKGTGSIKTEDNMFDIDKKSPDGTWVIKPGFERFAPLVHNGKRRKRPSNKDSEYTYSVPTRIAIALQEELGLSGVSVKHRSTSEEELLKRGDKIITSMDETRRRNLGSKSGTLHFVLSLGYPNKRGNLGQIGMTLKSDEDIQVPVIDIKKDNETGIDPVNDITYRTVSAGEKFDISLYELMYLIIQDEYAGFFRVDGNERGAVFSPNLTRFLKGEKKLPIPKIEFEKNDKFKFITVDISKSTESGEIEVKPEYVAKFGALSDRGV